MPYQELDQVIDAILIALQEGEASCCWVEPRGIHVNSCEHAYRLRAGEA